MRVALIVKPGHTDSGVGRYTSELGRALQQAGVKVVLAHPAVPLPGWLTRWIKDRLGWDLEAFFQTYPVWIRYPKGIDIYHFTSQNLASLLIFCPPSGKTIVTVHDIIPELTKDDKEINHFQNRFHAFFDRLSLLGLKKANMMVAVSEYTRNTVIDSLRVPPGKIQVTYEGV